MTFIRVFRRLRIGLFAAWAIVVAGGSVAAQSDWTLDRLMQSLSRQTSGQAAFVERKYLAVLDQPVESSGELRFRAPDRLEKITLKPRPESLVLEGDTVTVSRGKKQFVVQLSDYREIAVFIDSIRATLAGDRATLERTYALHLAGGADNWTLTLLPRDARMAELVLRIDIKGNRGQLREIEIRQGDGDRSVMEIAARGPTQ